MQNRPLAWISIGITLFCLSGCGSGKSTEPVQAFGTIPRANQQGENDFASLIRKYSRGQSSHAAWSGYWWPFMENGIYNAALNYEAATGKIGAAQWELAHHGADLPGVMSWFGHCNGWSAAAVLFSEPRQSTASNGVTFSVADQKALLSELGQEVDADYFGTRSNTDDSSDPSFQDIFPNQFFLVLTNIVGKGQSLIMDRYTGSQIWNQPIAGYQVFPITPADDLGAEPSAPGVYRILVTTQVWWLRDDVDPNHVTEPFTFEDGASYDSRILRFEIWTDAPAQFDESGNLVSAGKVVLGHQNGIVYGGAWQMGGVNILDSHPDYLWAPYSLATPGQYANPEIDANIVKTLIKNP
jgi:hypothetical protein